MKIIIFLFSCLFFINSNAQFGEQQIITTDALNANSVFAVDIDGDGNLDVLSASVDDDKIAWYKNTDGLGNFSAQQIISTNANGAANVIATDLDNDGDMDVISSSVLDDKLAWYENLDGLGNFGVEQIIGIDPFDFHSINAGDVDSDGDIDIITSNFNIIKWYENVNNGANFMVNTINSGESNFHFFYNFPIDIDGDGDIDVVSGSRGTFNNKIVWYENIDGLGNFGDENFITNNIDVITDIYASDLDGDGDIDILSASRNDNKIAWYENTDGQSSFSAQKLISDTASFAFSVYTTDIDNDGDQDVLSGSGGENKIVWYENIDGLGNFGDENFIATDIGGAMDILAAELNNDNKIDVVSTSDNKIIWFENLITLGVKEFTNDSIILLPNPVSTILTIENNFTNQIESIKIYDVIGKLVFQEKKPNNQLNVSKLSSGLLFVKIESDKGIFTKKIVKQ